MKFRVERDVLADAVAFVARALPARPVVPVLSGMLLQAGDDGLALSCFDYEVSARALIAAEVGEPGAELVPGRLLAEITRSLPQAAAEISTAAGQVTLTCGSAEFALVSLPLEEYPRLPELPAAAGRVDRSLLGTAAAQVVPSASRDDTLPMLTGVSLEFSGDHLTLAATDRYRLAVRTVPWMPADPAIRASALVPARTLAEVARTMSPGGLVRISVGQGDAAAGGPDGGQVGGRTGSGRPGNGMISFEGGGRRLTARLIGAEFVKYESRFRVPFEASAELPPGPFIDAVRRVSLVADRTTPVQLTFRRDVAVIEARSDGRARAVESVPVSFAGPDQVISFNPQWLLDGLTAAALTGSEAGGPQAGTGEPTAGAAAAGGTETAGGGTETAAGAGERAAGTGERAAGGTETAAGAGETAAGTGQTAGGGTETAAGAGERAAGTGETAAETPGRPAEDRQAARPPGRIRLQFTSPAKPAVISWADAGPATSPAETAFRYLLVPQRTPAAG